MTGVADQHSAVTQELLVRYLDAWTPAALHGARRITYAATGLDASAVPALRVFGEFADRLVGHRLDMVLAAPTPEAARGLADRLAAVHRELGAPAELAVHVLPAELVPALRERDALGGPLFAFLDATAVPPEDSTIVELGGNRGTELLLALDPATGGAPAGELVDRYRAGFVAAGLAHVVHVELVDGLDRSRLLLFATGNGRHLEKFKDELWAVDEFAGIRFRDPRDSAHALVDISLTPDLGPLRRIVLDDLARTGSRTVADLRSFALAETPYRSADVTRLLPALLTSGVLRREPDKGRLTPQTVLSPARPGTGGG